MYYILSTLNLSGTKQFEVDFWFKSACGCVCCFCESATFQCPWIFLIRNKCILPFRREMFGPWRNIFCTFRAARNGGRVLRFEHSPVRSRPHVLKTLCSRRIPTPPARLTKVALFLNATETIRETRPTRPVWRQNAVPPHPYCGRGCLATSSLLPEEFGGLWSGSPPSISCTLETQFGSTASPPTPSFFSLQSWHLELQKIM